MKHLLLAIALLAAGTAAAERYTFGGPSTTDNDDTCDIAQLPAATLLLPYFEVDLEDPKGETTLFSITNVTNVEQIAHVTLWTDLAYPVISFDVYLTGYDVQAINLYDVIKLGRVAPPLGTGRTVSKQGESSDANPALDLTACEAIPSTLAPAVVGRMQQAFTTGVLGTCRRAGLVHARAIGYATIDVVSACNSTLTPEDAAYYEGTLRFDNVLTGEVFQTNSGENFAQGSPLVHIRAIPDGGAKPFPYARTFYGRYQRPETALADKRQPLPTVFATRWVDGGSAGFQTSLKIWRERVARDDVGCRRVDRHPEEFTDLVRFDESENAISVSPTACPMTCLPPDEVLPAASRTSIDAEPFPAAWNSAVDGWLYLNLDSGFGDNIATQGWVVSSMRAEGRYSVDTDAVALGNGCSPALLPSEVADSGNEIIAPAANAHPAGSNDDTCDISLAPAATLLLPHFEVDLASRTGEQTIFTITNAGPLDQIAHVVIWTDYGYPVLTFDVYLTGYDVQSINLYDVFARGSIAPPKGTGTLVSAQGSFSWDNETLNRTACERLPVAIPADVQKRVREALTIGRTPECDRAGEPQHHNAAAVGYATIDVVGACGSTLTPADPEYYQGTLRYDNVLMGDYIQVKGVENYAQGSPMVHIRAIPEGGTAASRAADPLLFAVNFPRTFYSRYQTGFVRVTDARQPLPSTFAARWIDSGTGSFETYVKIWRESSAATGCAPRDERRPAVAEVIAFDEEENARGAERYCPQVVCPELFLTLPVTGRYEHAGRDSLFPTVPGALGGWLYFNLDDPRGAGTQQAWVTTSLRAEGRYSADLDATALGNGCSPP